MQYVVIVLREELLESIRTVQLDCKNTLFYAPHILSFQNKTLLKKFTKHYVNSDLVGYKGVLQSWKKL